MTQQIQGQRVAYLRVSALDQRLDRQRAAVGEVHMSFEEHASASSRRGRPELGRLLNHVRAGDEVVVSSMDRLARSVIDLAQITDELMTKGVRLRFVSEGVTYSPGDNDPYAKFQLHLLGSVAELERSIIRERQADGIAAAKARGVYLGRSPALSADDAATARRLVAEGVPKAEVARRYGINRSTLYRTVLRSGVSATD
ncbi:recombinase family protein [Nesterenkonia sp. E16_7]|nr:MULTISPECIES: recombinase family protein [unclassified Nesterenkonia]MBO0596946.1 recombinase family protein [Nesterenkonia sp. E16_10]MBO0598416.1 recombinase family protein [Nesterenkonia sp. E16_7]